MATPTVRKQIELPAGVAPSQVTCRLRLVATNDGSDGWGYVGGDNVDVAGVRTVSPDSTGLVEFTNVRPNSGSSGDQITSPTGTAYQLVTKFPNGATITEYIDVTDAAGPLYVQDILTVAPSAVSSLSTTYVAKAGDTMTGALVIDGANLTVDEGNVVVEQPAVPTGVEGYYINDSAGMPVAALVNNFLYLDGAGTPITLTASAGAFSTSGAPIDVGTPTANTHALSESTADGVYLRVDGLPTTQAPDPSSGEAAIYSQDLGGSAMVVVDDHGHRAPVGTDIGFAALVTRVSAGATDITSIGAPWVASSGNTVTALAAGLPRAVRLIADGVDETAGLSLTSTDVVMRGAAGELGAGFRITAQFWTPDTLSTWTTPGAGEGVRMFIGATSATLNGSVGGDDPTGHRVGLSFVNVNGGRGDTSFQISTKDGSTETLTSTAIAPAANTVYEVVLTQLPGGNVLWQMRNLTADPERELVSYSDEFRGGFVSASLPTGNMQLVAGVRAVGTPDKTLNVVHVTCVA